MECTVGCRYSLQSETFAHAGLNAAFDVSVSILLNSSTVEFPTIMHPCLQVGYNETYIPLARRTDAKDESFVRLIGDPSLALCKDLAEKVRPSNACVNALNSRFKFSLQTTKIPNERIRKCEIGLNFCDLQTTLQAWRPYTSGGGCSIEWILCRLEIFQVGEEIQLSRSKERRSGILQQDME